MKNKIVEEKELETVSGGNSEEALEFNDWAVRHIPELQDADPNSVDVRYASFYASRHIPEYGGYSEPAEGGDRTYYLRNSDGTFKKMTHAEFMAVLYKKYGN